MGVDIKPEFPKKPDVMVENYLNRGIDKISRELILKISKMLIA